MKKRIKIDSTLLSLTLIFTLILYLFPGLYFKNLFWDNVFDFIGTIFLLMGVTLRMIARGHKKVNSNKSKELVKTSIYGLIRNPMYLGSFLIGSGYLVIVWPLWFLPIFVILFYLRFKVQVEKEEQLLSEEFGQVYDDYVKNTPRVFPSVQAMRKCNFKEVLNPEEAFNTKEWMAIIVCPLVAALLEYFQELVIFGGANGSQLMLLWFTTYVLYAGFLLILYWKNPNSYEKNSE